LPAAERAAGFTHGEVNLWQALQESSQKSSEIVALGTPLSCAENKGTSAVAKFARSAEPLHKGSGRPRTREMKFQFPVTRLIRIYRL
jgi:hypothetical protein